MSKTSTQPPAASADLNESQVSFTTRFDLLSNSGVGVMIVHTREPHRVTRALRMWNLSRPDRAVKKDILPYKEWNYRDGWRDYKTNMIAEPEPGSPGSRDPRAALYAIGDVENNGKNAWSGLFVMDFFHYAIASNNPSIIQCLKSYCQEFSKRAVRLVLIAPDGFQLPRELENDIPYIDLELPSRNDLRAIYENVIKSSYPEDTPANKIKSPWTKDEVEEIISLGCGMTEGEFTIALSTVVASNFTVWPNVNIESARSILRKSKVEVVKRTDVLSVMEGCGADEIGGLDLYKEWLQLRKQAFTPAARKFGVSMPKGCLLIGPPGTGKSLCAKATGGEFGLPLIEWNVGRMMNSLVGQSEARVRSALDMLRKMAPVVVFFDEVDKMGIGGNSSGDSGVGKRIFQAILTFMQEDKSGVFWVVTANRAELIPSEFTRRGRLNNIFGVLPPTEAERLAILKIHLRKRNQPTELPDLAEAVRTSKGYVSAELESAVDDAVLHAFSNDVPVTGTLIANLIQKIKPLSVSNPEDFNAMLNWAERNATPTSTPEVVAPKRGVARGQDEAAGGAGRLIGGL